MTRLALALAFLAAASAHAEESDATAGRRLAVEVCGNCHVVEKGRRAPVLKPPAPAFAALAKRGALEPEHLRAFLEQPHGAIGANAKMPNPQLLDYQIDRIVAYAQTVKTGK
jgi:mono/diheme cytochrome c family protein